LIGSKEFQSQWTFMSRTFDNDIKLRGVSQKELPFYPYRDDSALWMKGITDYVTEVIHVFYGNTPDQRSANISADFELNEWANELHHSFKETKGGDPQFPEKFTSEEDLIAVCASIIFGCTCQHSIMNYGTNFYYSFVPNAPALLRRPFPGRGANITWDTIIHTLPDITECLKQVGMSNQLSMPPPKDDTVLYSNFQKKYKFANPAAIRAVNKWKQTIEEIEKKIGNADAIRTQQYTVGYEWLLPSRVAFVVEV